MWQSFSTKEKKAEGGKEGGIWPPRGQRRSPFAAPCRLHFATCLAIGGVFSPRGPLPLFAPAAFSKFSGQNSPCHQTMGRFPSGGVPANIDGVRPGRSASQRPFDSAWRAVAPYGSGQHFCALRRARSDFDMWKRKPLAPDRPHASPSPRRRFSAVFFGAPILISGRFGDLASPGPPSVTETTFGRPRAN